MTSLSMLTTTKEHAAALLYNSNNNMSTDDIQDRIAAMQAQEECTSQDSVSNDDHASSSSRSKMCHWSFQLADVTNLSRLSVSRSMSYLDRFIAASSSTTSSLVVENKREYQLASMTCLYLAIKLYEPLRLDASLLAEISAGCYTTQEILDMEQCILNTLDWRMNAMPTSQEYVSLILGLLNPKEGFGNDLLKVIGSLVDVATYQCELATADYELSAVNCNQSVVAVASILNALDGIIMDEDMDMLLSSAASKYAFLNSICALGIVDMKDVGLVQVRLRELLCQHSSSNVVDQQIQQQQQSAAELSSEHSSSKGTSPGQEKVKNVDDETALENKRCSDDSSEKIDPPKEVVSCESSKCPSPISIVALPQQQQQNELDHHCCGCEVSFTAKCA